MEDILMALSFFGPLTALEIWEKLELRSAKYTFAEVLKNIDLCLENKTIKSTQINSKIYYVIGE